MKVLKQWKLKNYIVATFKQNIMGLQQRLIVITGTPGYSEWY